MFNQRRRTAIHGAQRSKVWRGDRELRAQMSPERGRHNPHGIQQAPTHAQKADLQRQTQLQLRPAAIFNDLAFGYRDGKERFKFECRQLTWELLQT